MPSITPSQLIRMARCEVAGRTFGLDMAAIVGIQPSEVVRYASTATDEVIGTITSQGRHFPVYSLARLLGLPTAGARTGHCIVATDGVDVWGVLADRVSHIESRTASEVIPLPALITGSDRSMIRGVVCGTEGQSLPLIVLDLESIRPGVLSSRGPGSASSFPEPVAVESGPASHSTLKRLITFAAASAPADSHIRYAFSVTQVVEITRVPESVALPGSPAFVAGIANWRNRPLPLVRLTTCDTGSENDRPSSDRMAVVRVPECSLPLGLLVSPECEILTCPILGTTVSSTRMGVAPGAIRAAFQVAQRTLLFPRFSAHSVTV